MTSSESLAQNLAPELLYQIFSNCTPSVLLPTIFNTAPLNVSIVCRSWWAVTLDRTDLWATIHLSFTDLDRWFDAYRNRPLIMYRLLSGMCRLWLSRAHDAPLDVVLELHVDPDEGVLAEARRIYQALLENQDHWRSMHIEYMNMTDGLDGDAFSNLTPSPLLETLSGSVFHTSRDSLVTYGVGLDVSRCNRLECVALKNSIKVVPVTFEMQRLRILKFTSCNIDGLIALLQHSPNLEVLKVSNGTYGKPQDPDASSIIPLLALTDMDVKIRDVVFGWRDWTNLFRRLHCPSLINFRFIPANAGDIFVPLKNFFTRSRPPLERFFVAAPHRPRYANVMPHSIAAFLDILKVLPCLVFLEVFGYLAATPEFTDSLAINRPDGHGLCPLLSHTIAFYKDEYFQWIKMSDGQEMRYPDDPQ